MSCYAAWLCSYAQPVRLDVAIFAPRGCPNGTPDGSCCEPGQGGTDYNFGVRLTNSSRTTTANLADCNGLPRTDRCQGSAIRSGTPVPARIMLAHALQASAHFDTDRLSRHSQTEGTRSARTPLLRCTRGLFETRDAVFVPATGQRSSCSHLRGGRLEAHSDREEMIPDRRGYARTTPRHEDHVRRADPV
jgi:hypothetical protein